MNIDIISYTPAQYAALTEEQILEIKSAQQKKNRLDLQLEEALQEEKHRLIQRGIFLSDIFQLYAEKKRNQHAAEVERLREALLFYLQYSGQSEQPSQAPYPVDYSLSTEERYYAVREYYMSAYTDAQTRLDVFKQDEFVKRYVGEWYAVLYDYLRSYV